MSASGELVESRSTWLDLVHERGEEPGCTGRCLEVEREGRPRGLAGGRGLAPAFVAERALDVPGAVDVAPMTDTRDP